MGGRDRKREEHPSHEGLPLPEKLPTWLSREKGWTIIRRPSGVGCSGDDREEAGMSEIARRLLRALVDEAMAEKQAAAAEDVVGASGTDRQRGSGIRLRDELPNGRPPWKSRGVQDHAERNPVDS